MLVLLTTFLFPDKILAYAYCAAIIYCALLKTFGFGDTSSQQTKFVISVRQYYLERVACCTSSCNA